jgi:hypothetical protein
MKLRALRFTIAAILALAAPPARPQEATRLTEDDVRRVADTQLADFERSYQQDRPLSHSVSKTWQVKYHLQVGDRLAKPYWISMLVDDTTGHVTREK